MYTCNLPVIINSVPQKCTEISLQQTIMEMTVSSRIHLKGYCHFAFRIFGLQTIVSHSSPLPYTKQVRFHFKIFTEGNCHVTFSRSSVCFKIYVPFFLQISFSERIIFEPPLLSIGIFGILYFSDSFFVTLDFTTCCTPKNEIENQQMSLKFSPWLHYSPFIFYLPYFLIQLPRQLFFFEFIKA